MATTMGPRANTPARWQTALKRPLDEGVEIRQPAGCGMWIATSSSSAGTAHEVTSWACGCPAGQFGDPVCKHGAALLARVGRLALETEPEPPTPAAPAVPAVCATCDGKRWVYKHSRYGDGFFRGPCPACVPSAFPLRPAA
ncbi:MAG: hypothetical protein H0W06_00605 [Chloroflexia bacterium]|nr:hypothetical protein [Chloroflexia bacterium]